MDGRCHSQAHRCELVAIIVRPVGSHLFHVYFDRGIKVVEGAKARESEHLAIYGASITIYSGRSPQGERGLKFDVETALGSVRHVAPRKGNEG